MSFEIGPICQMVVWKVAQKLGNVDQYIMFLKYAKFNDFILRLVREIATISLFMMTIKDDTQIA